MHTPDALPLHAPLQGTADQLVTLRSRLILKPRLCKVATQHTSHALGVLTRTPAASSVDQPRLPIGKIVALVVTAPWGAVGPS